MARSRFVDQSTTRLDLSDGDWIEVRNVLGAGAQKRLEVSPLKSVQKNVGQLGSGMEVDFSEYSFARTLAYVVAWSLPIAFSRDALEQLLPDDYREIENAITAHVEARATAKKTQAGAPA